MPDKILVVDDEPDLEILLRQKFRQKINHEKLQLIFACNGIEALKKLGENPDIDVVLTDIYMPEMDGLTLLDKLREIAPIIKVIIISAYGDTGNIRAAMNRGAFDFLTKPINFEDLEITTHKTLQYVHKRKTALEKERKAYQSQAELIIHLQQEMIKRQQVEQELRASEQQLMQFLEAMPVGVFVVDAQGHPYYANQMAQQILGQGIIPNTTAEQLSIVYHAYLAGTQQIYPPSQQPIVLALKGKSATADDIELHQGDKIIPLEVLATPIFDEKGKVSYAIATFQDITQRKRAEAERIKFAQVETLLQQDKQKLEILANYDSLTHVANRRRFDECLQQEWKRLAREKLFLSLILCDVDFFKVYNDRYGHQAGDTCLEQVAVAIKQAVNRPADLVARYGGEEFAIILPLTDTQGAFQVAGKIQANLEALKIFHEGSPVHQYVTLSLGIASMIPIAHQSCLILVTAADSALYEAKNLGRNRIFCNGWIS